MPIFSQVDIDHIFVVQFVDQSHCPGPLLSEFSVNMSSVLLACVDVPHSQSAVETIASTAGGSSESETEVIVL